LLEDLASDTLVGEDVELGDLDNELEKDQAVGRHLNGKKWGVQNYLQSIDDPPQILERS